MWQSVALLDHLVTTTRPLLDHYQTTTIAIENIHGVTCISDTLICKQVEMFENRQHADSTWMILAPSLPACLSNLSQYEQKIDLPE